MIKYVLSIIILLFMGTVKNDIVQRDYEGQICLSLSGNNDVTSIWTNMFHKVTHGYGGRKEFAWVCATETNEQSFASPRPGYSYKNLECQTECLKNNNGEYKCRVDYGGENKEQYCGVFSEEPVYAAGNGVRCKDPPVQRQSPNYWYYCYIYNKNNLFEYDWYHAGSNITKTATNKFCIDNTCERRSSSAYPWSTYPYYKYQCNTTETSLGKARCTSQPDITIGGKKCITIFSSHSGYYCYTTRDLKKLKYLDGPKVIDPDCHYRFFDSTYWYCYYEDSYYGYDYISPDAGLDIYGRLCKDKCTNGHCVAIQLQDAEPCGPKHTVIVSNTPENYLCLDDCNGTCTTLKARNQPCDPLKTLQKYIGEMCLQLPKKRVKRAWEDKFANRHIIQFDNKRDKDKAINRIRENPERFVRQHLVPRITAADYDRRLTNSFIFLDSQHESRRLWEITDRFGINIAETEVLPPRRNQYNNLNPNRIPTQNKNSQNQNQGPMHLYQSPQPFSIVTVTRSSSSDPWTLDENRSGDGLYPILGTSSPGMVNHYHGTRRPNTKTTTTTTTTTSRTTQRNEPCNYRHRLMTFAISTCMHLGCMAVDRFAKP